MEIEQQRLIAFGGGLQGGFKVLVVGVGKPREQGERNQGG